MSSTTKEVLDAGRGALSAARMSTYEIAVGVRDSSDPRALALYAWNARASAAMLAPLHFCEVVIRNAVSDAIEFVYGPLWPWNPTFVLSLPDPSRGYSPRKDLRAVAQAQPSTGKVIPELKFVFWREMFTRRHDVRIWMSHFRTVFPKGDPGKAISDLRRRIFSDLDELRKLRNRIAHHEPIFTRNLKRDFEMISELIRWRSPLVASWTESNQDALAILDEKPLFRGGKGWVPSHDEIAHLAYSLWEEGGRRCGGADVDWSRAEAMFGVFR